MDALTMEYFNLPVMMFNMSKLMKFMGYLSVS